MDRYLFLIGELRANIVRYENTGLDSAGWADDKEYRSDKYDLQELLNKNKKLEKMSYNNSNQSNYNRGNSNQNRGYSNNQNQPPKKHSGCKMGVTKDGVQMMYGWMFKKGIGLIKIKAYERTAEKDRATKHEHMDRCVIKVQRPMAKEELFGGVWNRTINKITCTELGIVLSPNGGPGGYIGTYKK